MNAGLPVPRKGELGMSRGAVHALLDRLERAPAPLGLGVVRDDRLDAAVAVRGSATSIRVGGPRRTAWSSSSRMIV